MEKMGQHFMKNKGAIMKMIEAIEPQKNEIIIEIGPGKGALTIPLAEACAKNGAHLIAIEQDEELIKTLENVLPKDTNVKIMHGDALKILKSDSAFKLKAPYKVVGNIPYYLTGHLLRIIGEREEKPLRAVFTIQKEVANRMVAEPPHMNLLASTVQVWATPKIIQRLAPENFSPAPKVDSATICLEKNENLLSHEEEAHYYHCMRAIFKQPRKTLLNNLKDGFPNNEKLGEKALGELNIATNSRPQNLSIRMLINLAALLK